MRILQISSAKTFGGGEKHFVDLCKGLTEKGHDVFVSLHKDNSWEESLDFLPTENRLHISLRNSLDVLSARKIGRFLKNGDIDIIHAHLARDYPPASLAVRFFPKSKLILTRHVLFPMASIHKLVLRNVSKVIAVSSTVETNLAKTFPKNKIVCIPNGIEIEKWADLKHEEQSKEFLLERNIPVKVPLIGTVGELTPLKGQEDFVLAAHEVVKEFPDAHFVIVGKDNSIKKSYRQKLKRLVKVLKLEENFTFLNWVEDTSRLLSALDIFVSASHSESFGLAILEAMASGTAIIATNTDGARELLQTNEVGILTPIENPVGLAKKICELLKDKEKKENLGKKALVFARENFHVQRMIDQTERIYSSVLRLS